MIKSQIIYLNIFIGNSFSLLLRCSLNYLNKKMIKGLSEFMTKEQYKFNLDGRSKGFVRRCQEDESPYRNILKGRLEFGQEFAVRSIIQIMEKDLVYFEDVCDTIEICKDGLYKRFENLYIYLINNVSTNKSEISIDLSEKDPPVMAITCDSVDVPYWPEHLASIENNLFKKITNSQEYQSIKDKEFKLYNNDDEAFILLNNHPELYDFSKKMEEIKDDCDLSIEEKESWNKTLRSLILKFSGDRKSISSVLPWKNAAKIGELGLMHEIIRKGLMWQTLSSENMQFLIDYKWNLFGKEYLIWDLIGHGSLLIFFTFYCVLMVYLEHKNLFNTVLEIVLLLLSWFIAAYNLFRELVRISWIIYYCNKENKEEKNMAKKASKILIELFWSKFFLIEFIIYISIVFIIPEIQFNCFSHDKISNMTLKSVTSLTLIMIWWKLLYYMLPFYNTGPTVIMIFQVFENIYVILSVVVIILLGFGTMFFSLFHDKRDDV